MNHYTGTPYPKICVRPTKFFSTVYTVVLLGNPCIFRKNESLQRYISQIYLCNGKTVSRFLYVSANMCIRLSKNICNVRFNYSTCLTIIITATTMTTNRPEEPDGWDFIGNLDIEAEQQSFLLIAAVAFSFLESYEQNSKPVQIPKWVHQQIDWNEHVTKLLHENRFQREYRMSLEAFNQLLELLRPSITVKVVKSNASSLPLDFAGLQAETS